MPIGERVEIWNLETSVLEASLPHNKNVGACAFGPRDEWLVSADDHVRIWRVASGEELGHTSVMDDHFWGSVAGVAVSEHGHVVVSLDWGNNNFTPDSALLVVDPVAPRRLATITAPADVRFGQVAFAGGSCFVVADSSGRLHVGDAATPDEPLAVHEPEGGSLRPHVLETLPVATLDGTVAFVGADRRVNLLELGLAAPYTGQSFVVELGQDQPTDDGLLFEERLAGCRFLFTGKFHDTSKSFREDTAKELGATVTKTANAKVTHLVVAQPRYGEHKPSSAEKKLRALIDEGHDITVLNEQAMIDLFLPTSAESQVLLSQDKPRWDAWRKRYGTGKYPAHLRGIDLAGADLREARIDGLAMDEAELARCNFEGQRLSETTLVRANLEEANLKGVMCWRTTFNHANLNGADLSGADLGWSTLDGADLRGADLSNAKFSNTSFVGADLRGATIDRTHEGMVTDDTTRF